MPNAVSNASSPAHPARHLWGGHCGGTATLAGRDLAIPGVDAGQRGPLPDRQTGTRRLMRQLIGTAAMVGLLLLAGCAAPQPGPGDGMLGNRRPLARVQPPAQTQAQDSRVLFIVLHFTGENLADSLHILTRQAVSAHYLVSDDSPPVVYTLVDENRRAWHAGDSAWQGHAMLNASSVGIEIVNPGPRLQADGSMLFAPYAADQIDAVITLLHGIVARHGITPGRILGHSDIAPQRKVDPGPAFPWQRLAQAGLLPWPDAAQVAALQLRYARALPAPAWFAQQLARIGYRVPGAALVTADTQADASAEGAADAGKIDPALQRVIAAFQMKYRPALTDGLPDAETAALLAAEHRLR